METKRKIIRKKPMIAKTGSPGTGVRTWKEGSKTKK